MTVGHVFRLPGNAATRRYPLIDDPHFEAQIPSNSDSPQLASSHQSANGGWINMQVIGNLTQCEHPCRHMLASS